MSFFFELEVVRFSAFFRFAGVDHSERKADSSLKNKRHPKPQCKKGNFRTPKITPYTIKILGSLRRVDKALAFTFIAAQDIFQLSSYIGRNQTIKTEIADHVQWFHVRRRLALNPFR